MLNKMTECIFNALAFLLLLLCLHFTSKSLHLSTEEISNFVNKYYIKLCMFVCRLCGQFKCQLEESVAVSVCPPQSEACVFGAGRNCYMRLAEFLHRSALLTFFSILKTACFLIVHA